MTIQQNKYVKPKTSCWLCGDPAIIFELYLDDDGRRKPLAKIAACSKDHAEQYFKKFQLIINGGVK